MKVVYNGCFGGFSLSEAAIKRYWEIKGQPQPPEWYDRNANRADPVLVQVVEELGKDADGRFANLRIRDVPKGMLWRIDEYDGYERVMTVEDYEWSTAT